MKRMELLALVLVLASVSTAQSVASDVDASTLADVRAGLSSEQPSKLASALLAAARLDPTTAVIDAELEVVIAAVLRRPDLRLRALQVLSDWPLRRRALDVLLLQMEAIQTAPATRMSDDWYFELACAVSTFPDDRADDPLCKAVDRLHRHNVARAEQLTRQIAETPSQQRIDKLRTALRGVPGGTATLGRVEEVLANQAESAPIRFGELPTPEQRAWALATAGVYTVVNRGRHHLLGGDPLTATTRIQSRRLLRNWWGVTDQRSARQALAWLEQEGHRGEQDALIAKMRAMSPEERAAQGESPAPIVARLLDAKALGEHGTFAWDFCRLAAVAGWCHVGGYLDQDECMAVTLRAARELRQRFDSWESLFASFHAGRQIWWGTDPDPQAKAMNDAIRWMVKNQTSPCVELGFDLDLGK